MVYIPFIVIGTIIIGVIFLVIFAYKAEKARIAAMRASFESLGFTFAEKVPLAGVAELLATLPTLRNGVTGLIWNATAAPSNGMPTILLEHRFTTGTGKSTQVHYHTIATTVCPTDWHRFTLTPENFFQRLGDSWGLTKDTDLENPAFNAKWRLKCEHDDSTALVILTPEVQAALQDAPPHEWWSIGNGTIACCWKKGTKPAEIDALLQRLATLVQTLSPEVRELLDDAARTHRR
ncbi:MAG: hypothetical protein K2W85_09140 [Phycisphaerales bacterium]|nr:hypothetical protein [Phycisphaerales bacterium]